MNRLYQLVLTFVVATLMAAPASAAQYLETQYEFTSVMPESGDVLVLLVPEGRTDLALDGWSQATREQVTRATRAAGFSGQVGDHVDLLAPVGLDFDRLFLAGVGVVESAPRWQSEQVGAALSERLNPTVRADG